MTADYFRPLRAARQASIPRPTITLDEAAELVGVDPRELSGAGGIRRVDDESVYLDSLIVWAEQFSGRPENERRELAGKLEEMRISMIREARQ